jgi:hypothetical protein
LLKRKEENIGSEVVNVSNPYTCHFGCFKVQETPVLDDEGNAKKLLNILFSLFLLLLLRLQKEKLKV